MKSIALLASLLTLTVALHAAVSENFQQTYPFAAGTISLDNVNGDIEITAWDQPEVSLVAEKRAKNEEELKRVTIEVEASPGHLSIKTKLGKTAGRSFFGSWNSNSSVHYKLMVPAGVTLDKINTVNSAITVKGVQGPVNLDTVNGSISATGLRSDARLESVNGSLRAEFAALEHVRTVKLDSVNGRVEVTLPKGAGARIKTSTINGSSHVDQPIKLSNSGRHGLAGEIGSGGPQITLETVNGSITVREL